MLTDDTRRRAHSALDSLLDTLVDAAREAAEDTGALKPIDAAKKLGYRNSDSIRRLVKSRKLEMVNGLIPMASISAFLKAAPVARARQKRNVSAN